MATVHFEPELDGYIDGYIDYGVSRRGFRIAPDGRIWGGVGLLYDDEAQIIRDALPQITKPVAGPGQAEASYVYTMSCGHEHDSGFRRSEGSTVICSVHGPQKLVSGDFLTWPAGDTPASAPISLSVKDKVEAMIRFGLAGDEDDALAQLLDMGETDDD